MRERCSWVRAKEKEKKEQKEMKQEASGTAKEKIRELTLGWGHV